MSYKPNSTPGQNLTNVANPLNMSNGVGSYWSDALDPFNLTGHDTGTPTSFAPMPTAPGYIPGYDPSTMAVSPGLDQTLAGINLNTQGLDAFRQQALRKGPSSWANLATADQDTQASNQREQAAAGANASTAQAMDQLGARGGLSSGARERAAEGGANNFLNMSQGIARQSGLNKLQIGMNDEQNRISQLGSLPGMEVQALQPAFQKAQMGIQGQEFDVGQQTGEAARQNSYLQNLYNQQSTFTAAQNQAAATENSGKK